MEKKETPSGPSGFERVLYWALFILGAAAVIYAGVVLFLKPSPKKDPPPGDTIDVDHIVVDDKTKTA